MHHDAALASVLSCARLHADRNGDASVAQLVDPPLTLVPRRRRRRWKQPRHNVEHNDDDDANSAGPQSTAASFFSGGRRITADVDSRCSIHGAAHEDANSSRRTSAADNTGDDAGGFDEFSAVDVSGLWVTAANIGDADIDGIREAVRQRVDATAVVSDVMRAKVIGNGGRRIDATDFTALSSESTASAFALNPSLRTSSSAALIANNTSAVSDRRTFASRERLRGYTLDPILDWACLRRLTTWRFWPLFFVVVCSLLELSILVPAGPSAPYIYCVGTGVSGVLFYVHLSQYSRQLFRHCASKFDFWYQLANFAVLIACNTYAVTVAYGTYVTIVPHVFQAFATSMSVFAMDACFRFDFLLRSLVVCFYGLVVLAVLVEWRLFLGRKHKELIDFGVTKVQLSSLAESTAFTCAVFMLRFAFNFIVRKKVTVLVNFPLVEVRSASGMRELAERGEFSITLSPSDQEAALLQEASDEVAKVLPDARVYVVGKSRPRCVRYRCFCPALCALDVDGRCIVQHRGLGSIVRSTAWIVVHYCAILALLFALVPLPDARSAVTRYSRVALQGIAAILFIAHASQFSRGVIQAVVRTFEFWFLCLQVVILCACNAYRTYESVRDPVVVSVCLLSWLSFFACALLQDASHMSRGQRAIMHICGAVLLALELASWRFFASDIADRVIGLYSFDTTIGAFAQSCSLTLATYCVRYAYNAWMFGADAMVTLDASEVDSCYALDDAIANSPMGCSVAAWTAAAAAEPPGGGEE